MNYNEFRSIMGFTTSKWNWSWYSYIFATTTMASGHQKETKTRKERNSEVKRANRKNNSTERSGNEKTRRVSKQPDNTKGYGDNDNETTKERVRRKEQRILNQDQELNKLTSRVIDYITNQFEKGEVDRLPNIKDIELSIDKGISVNLLSTNDLNTIYLFDFKENVKLPLHNHSQTQTFQCLSGDFTITTYNKNGKKNKRVKLKENDFFQINPYINHIVKSNTGGSLITVFKPPIISFNSK